MSKNKDEIELKLASIIKEYSTAGEKNNIEITSKTNLFKEKILDSVMLIELLTRIENDFSVKVTTKYFVPENFSTIENMAQAIIDLENEDTFQ